MNLINTIVLDLPVHVRSFTRYNPDDTYTVVLNARLSREEQQKGYNHELQHIRQHDFEASASADLIETRTHETV